MFTVIFLTDRNIIIWKIAMLLKVSCFWVDSKRNLMYDCSDLIGDVWLVIVCQFVDIDFLLHLVWLTKEVHMCLKTEYQWKSILIPWKIFHSLSWSVETVRILLMFPRRMLVSYWLEVHLQKVVFSSFHAQLIYFVPVVDEFNTWWKPNKESLSKFDLH